MCQLKHILVIKNKCVGKFFLFFITKFKLEHGTKAWSITVTDICSYNAKLNKMEEIKNLEQNLDKSNEKLHISDVMYSVLSFDNIETFRKEYNDRMKVVFGVDDWIKHYEKEHSCKLEDFIGKTIEETKEQLSYFDRDWER